MKHLLTVLTVLALCGGCRSKDKEIQGETILPDTARAAYISYRLDSLKNGQFAGDSSVGVIGDVILYRVIQQEALDVFPEGCNVMRFVPSMMSRYRLVVPDGYYRVFSYGGIYYKEETKGEEK